MKFRLASAPTRVEELGSVQAAIAKLVESITSPELERIEVKGFEIGWFSSVYKLQILYGTGTTLEVTVERDILTIPSVIYDSATSAAKAAFDAGIPIIKGGARRRRSRKVHRKNKNRKTQTRH